LCCQHEGVAGGTDPVVPTLQGYGCCWEHRTVIPTACLKALKIWASSDQPCGPVAVLHGWFVMTGSSLPPPVCRDPLLRLWNTSVLSPPSFTSHDMCCFHLSYMAWFAFPFGAWNSLLLLSPRLIGIVL
jgi:hypothetical protein